MQPVASRPCPKQGIRKQSLAILEEEDEAFEPTEAVSLLKAGELALKTELTTFSLGGFISEPEVPKRKTGKTSKGAQKRHMEAFRQYEAELHARYAPVLSKAA